MEMAVEIDDAETVAIETIVEIDNDAIAEIETIAEIEGDAIVVIEMIAEIGDAEIVVMGTEMRMTRDGTRMVRARSKERAWACSATVWQALASELLGKNFIFLFFSLPVAGVVYMRYFFYSGAVAGAAGGVAIHKIKEAKNKRDEERRNKEAREDYEFLS